MHKRDNQVKPGASQYIQYILTGQLATVLEVKVKPAARHLSAEEVLQQARR